MLLCSVGSTLFPHRPWTVTDLNPWEFTYVWIYLDQISWSSWRHTSFQIQKFLLQFVWFEDLRSSSDLLPYSFQSSRHGINKAFKKRITYRSKHNISHIVMKNNHMSLGLFTKRVLSASPLRKLISRIKSVSLWYQALGACFRPYRAFCTL